MFPSHAQVSSTSCPGSDPTSVHHHHMRRRVVRDCCVESTQWAGARMRERPTVDVPEPRVAVVVGASEEQHLPCWRVVREGIPEPDIGHAAQISSGGTVGLGEGGSDVVTGGETPRLGGSGRGTFGRDRMKPTVAARRAAVASSAIASHRDRPSRLTAS